VSHLSVFDSRTVEKAIQEKLEQAYPTDQYPFDIFVAYTMVHITDYWEIDERQTVPRALDRDRLTLVLEAVARMIRNVKSHKQLTR